MEEERKKDLLALLLVCVTSGVVLLLASGDSWLHDLHGRYDSAWFFTCGRSWMEGMRPYIDFADSKGPLLWLIYGVGSLISPLDYTGVWWLTWACYSATFGLVYLTSRRFLSSRWVSLAVTWIMSIAFFNPLLFNEIRAEDFCFLPFMALLFLSVSHVCAGRPFWVWHGIASGAALGALLLIKYNLMAMASVFVLCEFVMLRRPRLIVRHLAAVAAGAVAVCAPMVAYLWSHGELEACWREYVLNAAVTTVSNSRGQEYGLHIFAHVLHWPVASAAFVAIVVAATWFAAKRLQGKAWMAWLCLVWFLGFTLLLSHQKHHFIVLSVLLVVPLALAARSLCRATPRRWAAAAIALAVLEAFAQNFSPSEYRDNFFTQNNDARREYYYIAGLVRQVPQARLLYYGGNHDFGVGTPVDARPCCRYWSLQAGATREMNEMHENAAATRDNDFLLIFAYLENHYADFQALGYYRYVAPVAKPRYVVFSPHKLQPQDLKVTNTDVLLKRPIITTPPW